MLPFTSLLVAISCLLSGQSLSQSLPDILQQQAYKAVQASVQGDYKTVLTFTYPRLVDLLGGPKKMLAVLKQQAPPMSTEPIHILIEKPGTIYKAGKELHALVPYVLTIPQKPSFVQLRGYQLAVSMNKGKHWYFVPTDQLTEASIHRLFPIFNPRLVIPPPAKAVVRDQP
ncbi:hypothetical protein GO755_20670 [Spirosoma sp. HMF4905]|uniref:Uncharacterized protein n=1 Tax=Spirosoma arboris TaxID=2682092 RepID=A0A7K1SF70_9BACT|nr:hypothetical protein [Spirosoma arboris]MVM32470.1 hypothetical protein [Spirosoma arboris]